MINRYNNKFFIFFAFLEDSGEVDRQKANRLLGSSKKGLLYRYHIAKKLKQSLTIIKC